jgi:hypothetical protein
MLYISGARRVRNDNHGSAMYRDRTLEMRNLSLEFTIDVYIDLVLAGLA